MALRVESSGARLIFQYRETGRIEDRRRGPKRPFPRRYTKADIGLLAAVAETLGGLCGAVTRRMMQRQYAVFGDVRFERLAGLSNSHLYRLRESTTYRRRRLVVVRTRSTQVQIGERRKPHPAGRPEFLRVDSVHQGDLDGEKGLYEINLVDEVTQYEFVAAVEGISERFWFRPWKDRSRFPLHHPGLHADNGSEYINHRVAALLRKRARMAGSYRHRRCGQRRPQGDAHEPDRPQPSDPLSTHGRHLAEGHRTQRCSLAGSP